MYVKILERMYIAGTYIFLYSDCLKTSIVCLYSTQMKKKSISKTFSNWNAALAGILYLLYSLNFIDE